MLHVFYVSIINCNLKHWWWCFEVDSANCTGGPQRFHSAWGVRGLGHLQPVGSTWGTAIGVALAGSVSLLRSSATSEQL